MENGKNIRRKLFSREDRLWYGVLVLFAVYLVLFVSLNWGEQVDDSYIYFRYAENLANGHGYVFNVGERVEGATGVLWTLILALFYRVGLPLEPVVRGIGFLCLLGTMVLVWRAAYRQRYGVSVTILVLALLMNVRFVLPFMRGLETCLYALLVGLISYVLVTKEAAELFEGWGRRLLSGAGVLMLLTRPESIFMLSLLVFVFLVFHIGRWKAILGYVLLWVGLLCAVGIDSRGASLAC